MWFNNKFNKDNTIHFDVNEWECTDADQCQFCRKISDTEFEYIQLKTEDLKVFVQSFQLSNKHLLEVLNDKTKVCDWYQDEIDVTEYDADDIADYISPYGGILDGSEGAVRNQLIAECIFETDEVSNDWYE
jgi:hypothetical protein